MPNHFLPFTNLILFPSRINAVLLKFDSENQASQFVNHLAQNQITVSPGNGNSNIGLDNSFVRIAIGTPEQMETVTNAIKHFPK